ncbi:MAG: peptidase S41 [Acidobacteria bacterium]|nr:peptidase S41 [Acidobacteriota bacterium]
MKRFRFAGILLALSLAVAIPMPWPAMSINDTSLAANETPEALRSEATPTIGQSQTSDAWCSRVAGGPSGKRALAIDLSAAHAGVRFFGVQQKYSVADQALAEALNADDAFSMTALTTYADRLEGVCVAAADNRELDPARVEMTGAVALVHPGTGSITLPPDTKAVAIDLRDLPAADGLREALETAVAPALASPVTRPTRNVRVHSGMTDEILSDQNVYGNQATQIEQVPIPATGTVNLPLALLTGSTMAPEAAELAGTLRLAGRAWLFGEDVLAEVAEARWQGVGDGGIAYRAADLFQDGRWPDVIPADVRTADPTSLLSMLPELGALPSVMRGESRRAAIEHVSSFRDIQPTTLRRGDMRAALTIVHGALRRFFPYFEIVGDRIDERLLETLGTIEGATTLDRRQARDVLRRFGEAIRDGHNLVYNYGDPLWIGTFPVVIDEIADEPVVARSLAEGVSPSDTIVSIDGKSAAEWYATEFQRTSAATAGYRFDLATRRFLYLGGPMEFGLRGLDGTTRRVTINPYPLEMLQQVGFEPSVRTAGWLMDLGAPDIYYINLNGAQLESITQFRRALREASGAAGLVLDMRGYPGVNHYTVAQFLICQEFRSPIFRIPVLSGPDRRSVDEQQYTLRPLPNGYCGPMVLLVGPKTVSAAENFSIMLVDAKRVEVVGRQSAGTNGNITGVQLPGGFGFSFTGMEVLFGDRRPFHGMGIVPDVEVQPTASDFRDGVDRALQKAIEVLKQTSVGN